MRKHTFLLIYMQCGNHFLPCELSTQNSRMRNIQPKGQLENRVQRLPFNDNLLKIYMNDNGLYTINFYSLHLAHLKIFVSMQIQ
jgi:hypothetical protein